jgi:hypothetical protein
MSKRFSDEELRTARLWLQSAYDKALLASEADLEAREIYEWSLEHYFRLAARELGFTIRKTAASESRGEGDGNGDAVSASQHYGLAGSGAES